MFKKALIVALVWAGLGACLSFGQSYIIPNESSSPTWTGVHTFVQSPLVPDPFTAFQAANKEYVDAHGGGSGPAAPAFAVQIANAGVTALQADPGVAINPTLHTFALGPLPDHAPPSGAFGLYGGLPTTLNVMVDCPAITGIAVAGDGSTDDYVAIQQCIWQRMNICPTFGVTCTPVDNRYPHPTNLNSTGVTFLFPQRSYTAAYGVGCSFFFSQGLDIPWGVNLIGTGAGFGETATKLCWPTGSNGLWLRSNDVVEHLALWNVAPGWDGSNLATYVLPVGWGGVGTGDGIILGGENKLQDLHIRYWGRHGIDCDSTRTDWPNNPITNLCDTNKVDHVIIYNNGGMGVYIHGSDGGVNQFSRVSAYQNQLYGAWDDALYASQFDSYLGDGNHDDATATTGSVPSISSTTCTVSTCTAVTSLSSGLFAGDLLTQTGCSNPNLNIAGITVASVPTGSSFTYINPSAFGATSPTGCSVLYRLGTHIWAAAGNTVPGQVADGGCVYGAQGHWIAPYCEGDQPFGTFVAQSPSVQTSVVENPQGVAKFAPVGAFVGSDGGTTTTGGIYDVPWNAVANTRLDASDANGGINEVFYNIGPAGGATGNGAPSIVTSENQQFSSLYFRRTFYGPGQNGSSNLSNWWCFMLPVNFTGALVPASGCSPDTTINGLTAVGVANGGSGYVSPVYKITSSGNTGQGATISCTNTGGVLGPCSIVTPGAGYNPNAAITVYDAGGSGTGASLTATVGNVASTDSGRSALNGAGLWYMPNSFCFGTLGGFVPSVCWTTGTVAPTSGSWKVGDLVFNSAYAGGTGTWAWENTAAGTPGTWTALAFGTGGGGATFPSTPSIVKNTSTTASVPAVLSDLTGLGAAPAASPTFTGTITTPITGSTQCLHVNSAGVISGISADCGTAITNAGVTGQFGYYAASGTAISPDTFFNYANTTHVDTATEGINTGQLVVTATQPQVIDSSYPNAASGGSIPLFLNKLNTSGQVIEATTSDTAVALFVVASSSDNGATVASNGVTICGNGPSGTNANACIVHGKATLTFDSGGGTIGHYCIESTITNGTCHDSVNPSGISCAGLITQTVAASGTGVIDTTYCQPQSVSLGGTVNTTATANLISIYPSTGTTVGPDTLFSDSGTLLTYTGTAGITTPFYTATGTQSGSALGLKLGTTSGFSSGGGALNLYQGATTPVISTLAAGSRMVNGGYWGWSSSTTNASAADTVRCRAGAAGVDAIESASTCTSTIAGATGGTAAAMFEAGGTTFTSNAGCTDTALTGGASGGHFTVGTSSACTTVITMGNTSTAAHGWVCRAIDLTTPANLVSESATNATTVTLGGTFSTSDVIWFTCGAV